MIPLLLLHGIPTKIKTVGGFVGYGDLEEASWRPRIDAVERCLNSWRSRSLSLSGKAFVINALALSNLACRLSCVYASLGLQGAQ